MAPQGVPLGGLIVRPVISNTLKDVVRICMGTELSLNHYTKQLIVFMLGTCRFCCHLGIWDPIVFYLESETEWEFALSTINIFLGIWGKQ